MATDLTKYSEGDVFDADSVDTGGDFEAIPEGWYKAAIVNDEERDTKAGNGSYIALEFEVLEGEYKGRHLWHNLNLNNPNQKAVEIARSHLAKICKAVGVPKPKSTAELHGKPLMLKNKVREYDGNKYNDLKDFKAVGDVASAASKPADSSKPWG